MVYKFKENQLKEGQILGDGARVHISGDLFLIYPNGRIELIENASIVGEKGKVYLEDKKFILVDKGV